MRKAILLLPFFIMSPVNAAEITSRITDSVQLSVDGAAVTSQRVGSSYSVSGTNVTVTTMGGLTGGSATAAPTISAGDYSQTTDGAAFTFAESSFIGDTPVTSQTSLDSNGRFDAPNLYSTSTTYAGGNTGSLAGSLSATSIPTVTAGGTGTTATGQRTIELSVFQ
jgi:hypothetical protein